MVPGLLSSALKVMRNYHFWVVVAMFAIGVILHYPQQLSFWDSATVSSLLGLTRHAVERVFLLVPITYASFIFGIRGGVASLLVACFIMLPRAIFISPTPADALFESIGIIVVGGVVNLWFYMHRRNIAQRKSAEEMLTKISDGSSIPSFVINKQHKVTHWNTAIEALSGIKKEEIIGTDKQWRAFYTEKRPIMADLIVDGAPADEIETYYDECKESRLIDDAYEAEDLFSELGEDGKWLHFTASPIRDNNGEITGAIETLEDITQRKSMEEMLAKIIDGSSIPSFVINKQHKVTHWNTAIEALSGIKKEEIIGTDKQWRAFYTEKRPIMADLIVDGAPADEIETYYDECKKSRLIDGAYEAEDLFSELGKDGKWLHFTASPIRGNNGEIIGAVETLEDVTERKNAEENLHYHLREITKAQEEERKRIARELHDDTAQNLIALLHQLENLLSDKAKLPVREAKALWSFYEQIRDILQEVRHFSRDLRPSILDDLGLLPALEWVTEELKNEYWVEASLKVVGDERRLSPEAELLLFRIVQEALRNTAKHAKATKAEVKVEFDESKIMVTISDNGIGFELPESLGALPYTGKLGLAGMQERVQLLGGSLKLESELGKGTTVFVEAPI